MPLPIKLNKSKWKVKLPGIINDPRLLLNHNKDINDFESSLRFIKFDNTYKYTIKNRQPLTDKFILDNIKNKKDLSVLEVGASCGINSIDLVKKILPSLKTYFLTDLFFDIPYIIEDNITYFYNPRSCKCVMAISDFFVFYGTIKTKLPLFNKMCNEVINSAPDIKKCKDKLNFLHPLIKDLKMKDSRIIDMEYDVFTEWKQNKIDIVKCANILNKSYFSRSEIDIAMKNLTKSLKENGILAITRNPNKTSKEISSIYILKNNKLQLLTTINGGGF